MYVVVISYPIKLLDFIHARIHMLRCVCVCMLIHTYTIYVHIYILAWIKVLLSGEKSRQPFARSRHVSVSALCWEKIAVQLLGVVQRLAC